jgi:hypothetical protein
MNTSYQTDGTDVVWVLRNDRYYQVWGLILFKDSEVAKGSGSFAVIIL